jgi:DNA-binding response OmpR family regulator
MNIGLGNQRRMILLIDADAHARAALRLALEAAGFSVGEAATDREGERTALRIKPDAVLVDLMLDPGDGGPSVAERLHAVGSGIACYVVSNAADALMGSVGLHEIGISGVFLKPVDTAVIVQTLRTRLGSGRQGRADA